MIKKAIIGGAAAVGLAGMLFGSEAVSYVRTSASWVKDSVRDSVPIEFEIERARKMLANLGPDIRQSMHVIAKEEAELKRLDREIGDVQEQLDTSRGHITRLRDDLASGQGQFRYAGHSYTSDQVKMDLANRFKRHQTKEATLVNLEKIHDARLKSLSAARQNLEGLIAAKRQLEVEVENIEARRKMVAATQTTCEYHFDDSQISRVRQLLGQLETRLEVEEEMMHVEGKMQNEIPLGEPVPDDIVDQVTRYFEGPEVQLAETADVAESR